MLVPQESSDSQVLLVPSQRSKLVHESDVVQLFDEVHVSVVAQPSVVQVFEPHESRVPLHVSTLLHVLVEHVFVLQVSCVEQVLSAQESVAVQVLREQSLSTLHAFEEPQVLRSVQSLQSSQVKVVVHSFVDSQVLWLWQVKELQVFVPVHVLPVQECEGLQLQSALAFCTPTSEPKRRSPPIPAAMALRPYLLKKSRRVSPPAGLDSASY